MNLKKIISIITVSKISLKYALVKFHLIDSEGNERKIVLKSNSGKILKIGKKVNSLKVNDHVIADSRVFCEDCYYCKKKLYHLCLNLGFVGELNDGGFAKFSIQKEKQLLKISKSIDLKNAALIEPLAVALHAISKFDNSKYNNVLIVGLGPIGVLSALSVREFGAKSIKIYDVNKNRLNKISHQLNFDIFDPGEDIKEHKKPNFCIDATNSPNALQFILNNISKYFHSYKNICNKVILIFFRTN